MLRSSDDTFQASDHGLTVTALTGPGDDGHIHMCLAGEIDMAALVALSKTVDWLIALAPVSVLVGLAFAGVTLPNFIVRERGEEAVTASAVVHGAVQGRDRRVAPAWRPHDPAGQPGLRLDRDRGA